MQFIPFRLFRNQPKQLRQKLAEEDNLIVTSNGEPFALMINLDPARLDETMWLVERLRAQAALSDMRSAARKKGLAQLSPQEIGDELEAARRDR